MCGKNDRNRKSLFGEYFSNNYNMKYQLLLKLASKGPMRNKIFA